MKTQNKRWTACMKQQERKKRSGCY
uniref:Uncharacterized protein n=1 Tax=Rhizophora mucronata TaxID=61149 RepID=A0A2P2IVQ7_RHIMU